MQTLIQPVRTWLKHVNKVLNKYIFKFSFLEISIHNYMKICLPLFLLRCLAIICKFINRQPLRNTCYFFSYFYFLLFSYIQKFSCNTLKKQRYISNNSSIIHKFREVIEKNLIGRKLVIMHTYICIICTKLRRRVYLLNIMAEEMQFNFLPIYVTHISGLHWLILICLLL